MAENLYIAWNSPQNLTAAASTGLLPTPQNTGTAGDITVMLQLATPAARPLTLVEYGWSFSGTPTGAQVGLVASNVAAGTTNATAIVAAGLMPYNNSSAPASAMQIGSTSLSTYSTGSTGVRTVTATGLTVFDTEMLSVNTFVKQCPLAREPQVPVSNFIQLLVLVPTTAVTCCCYVIWRE